MEPLVSHAYYSVWDAIEATRAEAATKMLKSALVSALTPLAEAYASDEEAAEALGWPVRDAARLRPVNFHELAKLPAERFVEALARLGKVVEVTVFDHPYPAPAPDARKSDRSASSMAHRRSQTYPKVAHRGYTGEVTYEADDGLFVARCVDEGIYLNAVSEVREKIAEEFRVSVDCYLDFCAEQGIEPPPPSWKSPESGQSEA